MMFSYGMGGVIGSFITEHSWRVDRDKATFGGIPVFLNRSPDPSFHAPSDATDDTIRLMVWAYEVGIHRGKHQGKRDIQIAMKRLFEIDGFG